MLTRNEFNELSHKPTPWTPEEEQNIQKYSNFIEESQKYIDYMSKENIALVDNFKEIIYSIQEKKDNNIPISKNEETILKCGAQILAISKKEQKEQSIEKAYTKSLKRNNSYNRHGGISAGLTILFITFNLGIFIASIILMLN